MRGKWSLAILPPPNLSSQGAREPDVVGYHNDRGALLARPDQEGELVSWGTLYGIGMGPGDPELLTRKAYRLLATVPVIFYPACGGKAEGFALDILQRAFTDQDIQASGTLPTRCLDASMP